jgi:hypothetical protein
MNFVAVVRVRGSFGAAEDVVGVPRVPRGTGMRTLR